MALLTDAACLAAVAVVVVSLAAHYHVAGNARTWFAFYGLSSSALIALSVLALLIGPVWPGTGAAGDIGVLLAGCAAFASSAWLRFAFIAAGEPDGR